MCGKRQLTVGGASPMHRDLSCTKNIAEQARGSETEQPFPWPLLQFLPWFPLMVDYLQPVSKTNLFSPRFACACFYHNNKEQRRMGIGIRSMGCCWDGHVGRTLELLARPLGAQSLMSSLKKVSRQQSSGVSASVPVSGVLP